jgi:hypothetical protein
MRTKTFKFQLEVEDVPYAPDTVEYLFGKGSKHNADYPENVMATEVVSDLFKDAIMQVMDSKMNFISQRKIENVDTLEGSNKEFWDYLCKKEERYKKIEQSIKPI